MFIYIRQQKMARIMALKKSVARTSERRLLDLTRLKLKKE
jgi:hypothetical protein